MTTTTKAEARDEVFTLFRTAWLADSTSQDLELRYEDVGPTEPPDTPANGRAPGWARLQMRWADGDQISLGGNQGSSIYDRSGIITVQVFAPAGDGHVLSDALTEIALNALEGKTTASGVRIRRARHIDVGIDGPWFQVNVTANFEYDRLK